VKLFFGFAPKEDVVKDADLEGIYIADSNFKED
jgi:hypothetical protein